MPWSVAAAVGGALVAGSASKSAAKRQAGSADYAAQLQNEQYQQTREDQAPYREAGYEALTGLRNFQEPSLRFSDVTDEPGYQFGLQQGLGNVQNTAAARGGLYSGNALKELTRYGNDYATTKYGDAYNRMTAGSTSRWNRLAALAGIGQTANNQVQSAGANFANNAGNISMANANAQGAAGMQQAGLWGNVINQAGSAASRWMAPKPSWGAPGQDNFFFGNGTGGD